jgi:ubiquitin carboxyl-terminal hydrolase 5/13
MTLSKVIEEGKVLPPVFGPDNTGMENLGNTCYMNSVVQVLMSMPEFKERYLTNANEYLLACKQSAINDEMS